MAKLKFEIDTDEIWSGDYDEPGVSFEELVRHAVGQEVKVKLQNKFTGEAFKTISKNIALECVYQVEKKLRNLINEDIVMQDRWGKTRFIGSVEDYIKKQIDEKMLSPVNRDGSVLTGCAVGSDHETWVEWSLKKVMKEKMKYIEKKALESVNSFCKKTLDNALEDFQKNSLTKAITKKLEAVGIG